MPRANFYRKRFAVIYRIDYGCLYYIGQSVDFAARIGDHVAAILSGKHALGTDTALQDYTFTILQNCDTLSDTGRRALEARLIGEYSSKEAGCVNKLHKTKCK